MLDDANSGWLYHIGDMIFGNVLLVNCEKLHSVSSVYASAVSLISSVNCIDTVNKSNRYDCIVVNLINDQCYNKNRSSTLNSLLTKNGVIAVIKDNETSFKNITSIKYPWLLFKKLFSKKNKELNINNSSRFYMQSNYGCISEVFYRKGYVPIKNSFLIKEKIRQLFLNRYTYPVFSTHILDLTYADRNNHKTVIDNVIRKVEEGEGYKFSSVNRCLVIPYKVLVSVSSVDDENYIFLLLRGSDRNVRANQELQMISFLNDQHPKLIPYISKSIASGIYKNIEYIVYRELHGVLIDAYFTKYDVAEHSAFNMLLFMGDISRTEVVIDNELFKSLTGRWVERLKSCFEINKEFSNYVDSLIITLYKNLNGVSCALVLFHGDFKIENVLFDSNDFSVTGIIDWDLAEKYHFPGLDLIYLILYSRRIKNSTSFRQESEGVFLKNGFTVKEKKMIKEYNAHFEISDDMFKSICMLFLIHHFSCRERSGYSEQWLMTLLNSVLNVK